MHKPVTWLFVSIKYYGLYIIDILFFSMTGRTVGSLTSASPERCIVLGQHQVTGTFQLRYNLVRPWPCMQYRLYCVCKALRTVPGR